MEYLKCIFRLAESPLGVQLQEGVLLGVIDRLLEVTPTQTPTNLPCTQHMSGDTTDGHVRTRRRWMSMWITTSWKRPSGLLMKGALISVNPGSQADLHPLGSTESPRVQFQVNAFGHS